MTMHRVMWSAISFTVALYVGLTLGAGLAFADDGDDEDARRCAGLPTAAELQQHLRNAATGTEISEVLGPDTEVGGLFGGRRMWAAVVNRHGELCAAATSTADPTKAWPGSQAIAKAKAFTANAFSHDDAGEDVAPAVTLPLSTANLYTLALPGHSLFGLNTSNPFDPRCFTTPDRPNRRRGQVCGGIITFGGGVSLHSASNSIIGGLGVSGDTACADHEIAKRVRDLAGLNPSGGPTQDDINYDPGSLFAHPTCVNTVQNGEAVGGTDDNPSTEDAVPLP